MNTSQKHAIVFGASGISGWRVVRELLVYPTITTFGTVVGVTNRPLTIKNAYLPEDSRLQLVSGVNLALSSESVISVMKEKIEKIAEITHAYLYAYVDMPSEGKTRTEANGQLVDNMLTALKALCPKLEHVILQTGGKVYGQEHFDKIAIPPTPWKESLPRVEEPEIAEQIFYYRQLDILKRHAEDAAWRWTEVRPYGIIGFAPTSNAMNLALLLGIFLSLWKKVHGVGSVIPYPGTKIAYERKNTDTPMGTSAKFQIFASLKGDEAHAQAFNIAAPIGTWEEKWSSLAAVFGLVGVAPVDEEGLDINEWIKVNRGAWAVLEDEYGLKTGTIDNAGWAFFQVFSYPFDRDYDTSRAREIGFTEEGDVVLAFREAWATMEEARLLPPAM